jgi:membrane associated rhomboid family serine protease
LRGTIACEIGHVQVVQKTQMKDLKKFVKRFIPVLTLIGLIWAVEAINFLSQHSLSQFGIRPRSSVGLLGIPLAPFLHVSISHAISNTVPVLVLSVLVVLTGRGRFWTVTILLILLTGLATWTFARGGSNVHLGASGLIFGYFGWLLARGFVERSALSIAAALVVILFYGGMFSGLLPRGHLISYESHLAGFVVGAGLAWLGGRIRRR